MSSTNELIRSSESDGPIDLLPSPQDARLAVHALGGGEVERSFPVLLEARPRPGFVATGPCQWSMHQIASGPDDDLQPGAYLEFDPPAPSERAVRVRLKGEPPPCDQKVRVRCVIGQLDGWADLTVRGAPPSGMAALCIFDTHALLRLCRSAARWRALQRHTRVEQVAMGDDWSVLRLLSNLFPIQELEIPSPSPQFEQEVDQEAEYFDTRFRQDCERGPAHAIECWKELERLREMAKQELHSKFGQVAQNNAQSMNWAAWVGTGVATAKLACDVAIAVKGGPITSLVYGLADANVGQSHGDASNLDTAVGVALTLTDVVASVGTANSAEATKLLNRAAIVAAAHTAHGTVMVTPAIQSAAEAHLSLQRASKEAASVGAAKWLKHGTTGLTIVMAFKGYYDALEKVDSPILELFGASQSPTVSSAP